MDAKKRRQNSSQFFDNYLLSTKQWKESPPGPEQRELDRLFANNLIDESDCPNDVRKKHPIFLDFSAKVFGVHFRKTKAKSGKFSKL